MWVNFAFGNKQCRLFFSIRIIFLTFACSFALVAELVDALDLGSSGFGRAGSSPVRRTSLNAKQLNISCLAF